MLSERSNTGADDPGDDYTNHYSRYEWCPYFILIAAGERGILVFVLYTGKRKQTSTELEESKHVTNDQQESYLKKQKMAFVKHYCLVCCLQLPDKQKLALWVKNFLRSVDNINSKNDIMVHYSVTKPVFHNLPFLTCVHLYNS